VRLSTAASIAVTDGPQWAPTFGDDCTLCSEWRTLEKDPEIQKIHKYINMLSSRPKVELSPRPKVGLSCRPKVGVSSCHKSF